MGPTYRPPPTPMAPPPLLKFGPPQNSQSDDLEQNKNFFLVQNDPKNLVVFRDDLTLRGSFMMA